MTMTHTAPNPTAEWVLGLVGLVLGEPRSEWNHSCTSQCPNPCPASSMVDRPEADTVPVVTG